METPLPFKEVVETTSPNYNQGHFTNPGMILDLGDSFEPDHNKETAQPNAFDQALLLPSINKPNLPVDQRENRNEYVVSGTLEVLYIHSYIEKMSKFNFE